MAVIKKYLQKYSSGSSQVPSVDWRTIYREKVLPHRLEADERMRKEKKKQILAEGLRETSALREEEYRLRKLAGDTRRAINIPGAFLSSAGERLEDFFWNKIGAVSDVASRVGKEIQRPTAEKIPETMKPITRETKITKVLDDIRSAIGRDLVELSKPLKEVSKEKSEWGKAAKKFTGIREVEDFNKKVEKYVPIVDKYSKLSEQHGEEKAISLLTKKEKEALVSYAREAKKLDEALKLEYKGTQTAAVAGSVLGEIAAYYLTAQLLGTTGLPGKASKALKNVEAVSKLPTAIQKAIGVLGEGSVIAAGNVAETAVANIGRERTPEDKKKDLLIDIVAGIAFPTAGETWRSLKRLAFAEDVKPTIFRTAANEIVKNSNKKASLVRELLKNGVVNNDEAVKLLSVSSADELVDALKSIEKKVIEGPVPPTKITSEPIIETLSEKATKLDTIQPTPEKVVGQTVDTVSPKVEDTVKRIVGYETKIEKGTPEFTLKRKDITNARKKISEILNKPNASYELNNNVRIIKTNSKVAEEMLTEDVGNARRFGKVLVADAGDTRTPFQRSIQDIYGSIAEKMPQPIKEKMLSASRVWRFGSSQLESYKKGNLGKIASEKIKEYIVEYNSFPSRWADDLADIKKLDEKGFLAVAKKVYSEVPDVLEKELGIKVPRIENYMRRKVNPAYRRELQQAIKSLIDDGTIKVGEGDDAITIYKILTNKTPKPKASFMYSRTKIFPILEQRFPDKIDKWFMGINTSTEKGLREAKAMLVEYVNEAGKMAAYKKAFDAVPDIGSYGKSLDSLIFDLTAEYGDSAGAFLKNTVEDVVFGTKLDFKQLRSIRAFHTATKLSTASIQNMFQSTNTVVVFGEKHTANAFKKYFSNKQLAIDYVSRHGIDIDEWRDYFLEIARKGEKGDPMVTLAETVLNSTQFTRAERMNRSVAALAAEEWLFSEADKFQKGKKLSATTLRRLNEAGIHTQELLNITDDTLTKIMNWGVGKTQFNINALSMPTIVTRTGIGKTITQFKPFGMGQMKMLIDEVLKPAIESANPAPIVRYIAYNMTAGNLVRVIKGYVLLGIVNKLVEGIEAVTNTELVGEFKPQTGKMSLKDIKSFKDALEYGKENIENSGGFGFLVSEIEALKYSDTPQEAMVKAVGGVSVSEFWDIADLFQEYITGKNSGDFSRFYEKGEKLILRDTPLVGWALKKLRYPYNPRESDIYDILEELNKENAGLGAIRKEDVKELANAISSDGDTSRTVIGYKLVNKLEKLEEDEAKDGFSRARERLFVKSAMEQLNIDPEEAKKFWNEYTSQKEKLKSEFGDEETKLMKTNKKFILRYLKEKNKSLDDYPKLKEYVDKYGWD